MNQRTIAVLVLAALVLISGWILAQPECETSSLDTKDESPSTGSPAILTGSAEVLRDVPPAAPTTEPPVAGEATVPHSTHSQGAAAAVGERDATGRGFHHPTGARPKLVNVRGGRALLYLESTGCDEIGNLEVRSNGATPDDPCRIVRLPGALLVLAPAEGIDVGNELRIELAEEGRVFAAIGISIRAGANADAQLAKLRVFTAPNKSTGLGRLLLARDDHPDLQSWKAAAMQTVEAMAALFEDRAKSLEGVGQTGIAAHLRRDIARLVQARLRYIRAITR